MKDHKIGRGLKYPMVPPSGDVLSWRKFMVLNKLLTIFLLLVFTVPSTLLAMEKPIIIGGSLGLTGKYAKMGEMKQKGFKLWEEYVNSKGGLLGRRVKVVLHDDNSNVENARSIYRRLIEVEKVDLLLGPYSSGITAGIMPLLDSKGYPLLSSGGSGDKLWQQGYQYLFGVVLPASRYAVGFLEMIAMNGMTQVAIIAADDVFSSPMAEGTKKWAQRFGLEVSLNLQFKKGTRDLTDIANQVSAAKVPAVVVCGHFNEAVDMRMALKKIGYQPTAYYASVGPAMQKYQDMLGKDAEHSFSASQWERGVTYKSEDREIFLVPFEKTYGVSPSYHAAQAFAGAQILAAAVEKAGTLDRETIRDTLATLNYISIIGRYGVDKTGLQTRHFPITTQWQNGVKKIVWPEELATAKPVFTGPGYTNN